MFLLQVVDILSILSSSSFLIFFLIISLLSQWEITSWNENLSFLSIIILSSYFLSDYCKELDSLLITLLFLIFLTAANWIISTLLVNRMGDFSISLPTQKSFMSKNLFTAHFNAILVRSIKCWMRHKNICYLELWSNSLYKLSLF